jgi:hypothetical protein
MGGRWEFGYRWKVGTVLKGRKEVGGNKRLLKDGKSVGREEE